MTLAFVTTLQRLPARQRAVLVLRDVLGFRAAEVAGMLDSSEASVNSALQRARATLEERRGAERTATRLPRSSAQRELVTRFADAVESGDVDAMVSLLTDDAVLTMPPMPVEYDGLAAIGDFLARSEEGRGAPLRVLPTRANDQPALVGYLGRGDDPAHLYGAMVLTVTDAGIAAITWFMETEPFRAAGLPEALPPYGKAVASDAAGGKLSPRG